MSKNVKIIIVVFCLLKITLHLISDTHSGFQIDEFLYIESGNHLSPGYMEFPPIIGLLAFLQNLFKSQSLFIHHLFSHIASIVIMIFTTKIAIEFGGKEKAVFLLLLGLIIAPSFGRSQQLFQPVVFSQLFGVLSFYHLAKFTKSLDKKNLIYLVLFSIFGFLTKYDSIFFIFGLLSLLLFEKTRNALVRNKFWIYLAVGTIFIIPNIIWQVKNDFPALQMFERLNETQLEKVSKIENLVGLLISINPINIPFLLIPAILFFFKKENKHLLPIFISIILSFSLLFLKNGKFYYFFPIILTLLPFGAVVLENIILQKRKWLFYPITILMVFGIVFVPFGMPVYSFNRYLKKIYPFEKKKIKNGKFGVKYDEYYSEERTKSTLINLKKIYDSLPETERKKCSIWGKHYSQAGLVSLYRETYKLPKAFSYHGSFYSWAPSKGKMPETVIAISYDIDNFFEDYFGEVKLVKTIYNPYSENEEQLFQHIYICKQPKYNFEKMQIIFRKRIFE